MAQQTFSITAGGDDSEVYRDGATYTAVPNAVNHYTPAANTSVACWRSNFDAGVWFEIGTMLLRFNTSALPDDAIVTDATLRVYVQDIINSDGLSVTADWLAWTGSATTDWSTTALSGAISGIPLSSLLPVGQDKDLPLENAAANVSKTGVTSLRLGLTQRASNATPTGENHLHIAPFEHATQPEARLIVTYTEPSAYDETMRPTGVSGLSNLTGAHTDIDQDPDSAITDPGLVGTDPSGLSGQTNGPELPGSHGTPTAVTGTYQTAANVYDGNDTTAATQSAQTAGVRYGNNFTFPASAFNDIPAGATITGISVKVRHATSNANRSDEFFQLCTTLNTVLGNEVQEDATITVANVNITEAQFGATPTLAQLTTGTFAVRATTNRSATRTYSLYEIEATVTYNVPGSTVNTQADVALADPSGTLQTGAATGEIRARIRKKGTGLNPQGRIELRNASGSWSTTVIANTTITESDADGQLISGTFDQSIITDKADVVARFVGTGDAGGLAELVAVEWNAEVATVALVGKTAQVRYDVYGRASTTRELRYDVYGRASTTRQLRYDVYGRASTTRQLRYDVYGRASTTRQLRYDVIGFVGATRQLRYDVYGRSGTTRALLYDVRGFATSPRPLLYDVYGRSGTTRALLYDVFGRASSGASQLRYDVYGRSGTTRALLYDVYGRSGATRALLYDVYGRSGITRALLYDLYGLAPLGTTRQLLYNVLVQAALAGKSAELRYDVFGLAPLGTTRQLLYDVFGRASTTRQVRYDVYGRASQARQVRYDVLQQLLLVGKSAELLYDVYGRASAAPRTLLYDVYGRASPAARQLRYDVYGRASQARQVRYDAYGFAGDTNAILYNVHGFASKAGQLRFEVYVLAPLSKTGALRYDVYARSGASRILLYNVLAHAALVGRSAQLLHDVYGRATKNGQARYDVYGRANASRNLLYDVRGFSSQSRHMLYDIYGRANASRPILYNLYQLAPLGNLATRTLLYDVYARAGMTRVIVFRVEQIGAELIVVLEADTMLALRSAADTHLAVLGDAETDLPVDTETEIRVPVEVGTDMGRATILQADVMPDE